MKLYTKKEKKLSGSFWEINILSEKLTTTTTDDDRRRRTTDESALEKLRCLSAGGAKKFNSNSIPIQLFFQTSNSNSNSNSGIGIGIAHQFQFRNWIDPMSALHTFHYFLWQSIYTWYIVERLKILDPIVLIPSWELENYVFCFINKYISLSFAILAHFRCLKTTFLIIPDKYKTTITWKMCA